MLKITEDSHIIDIAAKPMDETRARQLNILTLAYLGDSIHDLFVRSKICMSGADKRINDIHKEAVCFVNANAQANFADSFLDEFTQDELSVFKRGRNSKSMPTKNTDKAHYCKATGLEAVFGYLYISGKDERLLYILNKCYIFINEGRKEF